MNKGNMIDAKEAREYMLRALDTELLEQQVDLQLRKIGGQVMERSKLGVGYLAIKWEFREDTFSHPKLLESFLLELKKCGYRVERSNWVSGLGGDIRIDWTEDLDNIKEIW